MGAEFVLGIGRTGLEMMLVIALPLLGVALVIGLLVSVLQAVTQINETTLSFLPKLIALALALVLGGPWFVTMLTDYIRRTLMMIPQAVLG